MSEVDELLATIRDGLAFADKATYLPAMSILRLLAKELSERCLMNAELLRYVEQSFDVGRVGEEMTEGV